MPESLSQDIYFLWLFPSWKDSNYIFSGKQIIRLIFSLFLRWSILSFHSIQYHLRFCFLVPLIKVNSSVITHLKHFALRHILFSLSYSSFHYFCLEWSLLVSLLILIPISLLLMRVKLKCIYNSISGSSNIIIVLARKHTNNVFLSSL